VLRRRANSSERPGTWVTKQTGNIGAGSRCEMIPADADGPSEGLVHRLRRGYHSTPSPPVRGKASMITLRIRIATALAALALVGVACYFLIYAKRPVAAVLSAPAAVLALPLFA